MIIKVLGMNNNSFSVAIGANPTVIHNIIKGRNAPGYDILSKMALSFDNINMNWLITGKGEMEIKQDKVISGEHPTKNSGVPYTEPPACEKCKMKDELITSLHQQIDVQHKLIECLEEMKSPHEYGQKRKAAS